MMRYPGKIKGFIYDIIKYAVHDGPGIRTTVFFKGCQLACRWCQNPESWQPVPRRVTGVHQRRYLNYLGSTAHNIIGREVTVDDVLAEVEKDMIFYTESNGGVTFSGGEPLMQPEFLLEMLKASKKSGIHTALDTSGFAPWEVMEDMIRYVDLFLFDLKIMDEVLHCRYTGESNMVILENLKELAKHATSIIIRFPLIPAITDTISNIRKIGQYVQDLKGVDELHILPYNAVCRDKYRRLKVKYSLKNMKPPSDKQLSNVKRRFESFVERVKIGGW